MELFKKIIGDDAKVTVEVTLEQKSITRLCVGLAMVIVASLFIYGIIKKTI